MKLYSPSKVVNPFSVRKFGYGTGQSGGSGTLTPPTLAPVLTVTADLGSNTANLDWTASNKITSPGFGYRIYIDINGGGFTALTTVSGSTLDASYTPSPDPTGEIYSFYIEPFNDAGPATGGGLSNQASIVLPGEPDGPVLLGPDGTTGLQFILTDFTLTWSTIPGAATYDIYASTIDSGYTLFAGGVTDTYLSVLLSSAIGVANWWYVVAYDGVGHYSGESNHLECEYAIASVWILSTGFWDDDGVWEDSSTWND